METIIKKENKISGKISKKNSFQKENKTPDSKNEKFSKKKFIKNIQKIPKNNNISSKKNHIDKELTIKTNNINTLTNSSDILVDKKKILKTEIFNNKKIIPKSKFQKSREEEKSNKISDKKSEKEKESIDNSIKNNNNINPFALDNNSNDQITYKKLNSNEIYNKILNKEKKDLNNKNNINPDDINDNNKKEKEKIGDTIDTGEKKNIYKNKNLEKNNRYQNIRKISKENFRTIILQKKLKLFSFSNEQNNNNSLKGKEPNLFSISSKDIIHDKQNIEYPLMTEIREDNNKIPKKKIINSNKKLKLLKSKISYKKLKLDLNTNNNKKIIGENENKEILKLETKINNNREKLFNSKDKKIDVGKAKNNSIDKEKKGVIKKNKIINFNLKTHNNKLYNSNKLLVSKDRDKEKDNEIKLPNKSYNKTKDKDKEKIINHKKDKTPDKVDINSFISKSKYISIVNDNFKEMNYTKKLESNIDSLKAYDKTKNEKLKQSKIKIIKNEEIKEGKEQKNDKNNNKILEINIDLDIEKKNEDSNNNPLILPLNTIDIDSFKASTMNKLTKNNHYKTLFSEITDEKFTKDKEQTVKKKFRFSERKKNNNVIESKYYQTESNENYYDLYNKAFNDNSSLEQKFSFKPKTNKKYFKNDKLNNNDNNNADKNQFFDKKPISISYNPNQIENIEINNDIDLNKNQKNISFDNNDNEFDNNKNFILDLNHYIPIDKNKLINTFSKPLFYERNGTKNNKI